MNILPHKSWHVYNQKNREKVQRDEAQAKEQEQQASDRAIKAEREYRLSELRRKAKARQSNTTDTEPLDQLQRQVNNQTLITSPTSEDTKPRHINLWSDVETQEKNDKGHQRKSVPEKNERVGLKPLIVKEKVEWYLEDRNKRGYAQDYATGNDRKSGRGASKDTSKDRNDPLNAMRAMLSKRDETHMAKDRSSSSSSSRDPERKKDDTSKVAAISTIEKLRKERFEREEAEKAKARALLDPLYVNPGDRHRSAGGYNQQFNPDATRQAHRPYPSRSRDNSSRHQKRYGDRPSGSGESVIRDDYPPKRRKYD
ncbi:hypothetical protein BGX26_003446 [Mortierella sp. AD094]|nr:hypothetical protein BGX26_003446 [Mortierella sp. AD094]